MIPDFIQATLKTVNPQLFPNVTSLLCTLAILPVTSCECERSVSTLRRLKTYMRTTMGNERMNGLALMHVHRDIKLNHDELLDSFALRHPRRMQLINPAE